MTQGKNFILEMLEMYKERPCLWQVAHLDYHDKNRRSRALEDFVSLFRKFDPEANKETVIKKINSMRGSFKKEVNKVKKSKLTATTIDQIHVPKLWYYDKMLFLLDQEPSSKNNETGSSVCDDYPYEYEDSQLEPEDFEATSSRLTPMTTADQVLEKIANRLDDPLHINVPQKISHEAFGDMVAESLRNIPPDQVTICKKLIYDVIYSAEIGLLSATSEIVTSLVKTE